jgi:hypothetical protein
MKFRAALRRLNRLFPPPSPDDRVNEEIRAALRPLTYEQKLRLRGFLRKRLEANPDDNDKPDLRSIFKAAEPRKKKLNRPKKSDGRSRATKQSSSTRSGVRRRKIKDERLPRVSTTNKGAPLEVLTAPNDTTPAKGSMATDDARRATVSAAPDSALPPTVPVLNDAILAEVRSHGANGRALAERIQKLPLEKGARVLAEIDKHKELANFLKRNDEIARQGRGPQ